MNNIRKGGVFSAAALLVVMNTPLLTFAEEQRVLEEIIVTATRVESSLQDTSIAVSAFNSDMMEDMNLASGMDYEALVPSLSIQLSPNRTSIRGVGRFDNSLGIAPGVAMYEDGGYNQENTALGVDSMNTERIEILRGPQGTLFGRNTTGGAINIISKKPTDELFFEARASMGNYGTSNAKFLVSGPLTDTFRGKVYFSQWWSDGLYDNISGQDTRDATNGANYYGQWMLDWQPTDRLYILYKGGTLANSTYVGGTAEFSRYDSINVTRSSLGGYRSEILQVQAGIEQQLDPWKVDINDVGEMGLDNHMQTTFHVIYDFDEVQVKYIFFHNRYDWHYLNVDYDGTSNPVEGMLNDVEQNQRIETHEITFTSTSDSNFQWIAGAYALDDHNWQPWSTRDNGGRPELANVIWADDMGSGSNGIYWYPDYFLPVTEDMIVAQNPMLYSYYQYGLFENQNWSVFGEGKYTINDEWAITIGARYSEDDMKGTENNYWYTDTDAYIDPAAYWYCPVYYGIECVSRGSAFDPTARAPGDVTVSKDDYSDTSGRIIVDYTPDENNLYWFTLSNAFKVGGLRLGAVESESTGQSPFFDSEEVTMYELGWKGTVSDTLNVEVIGFFYDYSDLQQLRPYVNEAGLTMAEVINVDAEMYGIELTGTWLATGNLILYSTYSYNHAEFSEDKWINEETMLTNCDAIGDFGECMHNLNGNRLDITPDHKFAVNALYSMYTSVGEFQIGGTYSYVGEREMDVYNSPQLKGDNYIRLDLSATWRSNDEHWKIEALVRNVTDELWYNTKSASANTNTDTRYEDVRYVKYFGNPANPRMYTLELQYNL